MISQMDTFFYTLKPWKFSSDLYPIYWVNQFGMDSKQLYNMWDEGELVLLRDVKEH